MYTIIELLDFLEEDIIRFQYVENGNFETMPPNYADEFKGINIQLLVFESIVMHENEKNRFENLYALFWSKILIQVPLL